MSEVESRAVLRAAGILFATSVLRLGIEMREEAPSIEEGRPDVVQELLAASDSLLDEELRRNTPMAAGETLDPNTADEVELDRLPGVGPATARAIVEAREEGTVFRSAEDLSRIRGIGPSTVRKLLPHVGVDAGPVRTAVVRGTGGALTQLNRADSAALLELSGIGPALAGRILEARRTRGRFDQVEDLLEISGIGPAILARIRVGLEGRE